MKKINTKNSLEAFVGIFVIFLLFAVLAIIHSGGKFFSKDSYYSLGADFTNVDGLKKGGDVKINGVKIGDISKIRLREDNMNVEVLVRVKKGVKINSDSIASISRDGLIFGDCYINISVGFSEEFLKEGENIKYTRPSLDLEKTLHKLVSSMVVQSR